jgi:hypothetical protein
VRIEWGSLRERDHLEGGRIILKWILKINEGVIRLKRLWVGLGCVRLSTQWYR